MFNDIGISGKLDFPRIKKLLSIGIFSSLLHLVGAFILGWGSENETLTGALRLISAYTETSDGGIFAASILGLFGMTLEGLSMFGIYRLMAETSPKYAHSYRSGIFGYLMFGACGVHVPLCAVAFLEKHGLSADIAELFASYFILPSFVLFLIFFAVLQITQIRAFSGGKTPCPRYCAVFVPVLGTAVAALPKLFGNYPFTNALFFARLAIGNLWTFTGLLISVKSKKKRAYSKSE